MSGQKGFVYYRCHTKGCPTTAVREDRVEGYIREQLAPMVLSDAEYEALRAALAELETDANTQRAELSRTLTLQKDKIAERLNRLTDAYLDQMIEKEAHETRRKALLMKQRTVEEKLAALERDPGGATTQVSEFLEQARILQHSYDMALPYEKRTFLRDATSNRTVSENRVEIRWQEEYRALADRPKVECCDHVPGTPRTLAEFIGLLGIFLASTKSTTPRPSGSNSNEASLP